MGSKAPPGSSVNTLSHHHHNQPEAPVNLHHPIQRRVSKTTPVSVHAKQLRLETSTVPHDLDIVRRPFKRTQRKYPVRSGSPNCASPHQLLRLCCIVSLVLWPMEGFHWPHPVFTTSHWLWASSGVIECVWWWWCNCVLHCVCGVQCAVCGVHWRVSMWVRGCVGRPRDGSFGETAWPSG
jgi:hypothetical protein